jgi:hypothetical protein
MKYLPRLSSLVLLGILLTSRFPAGDIQASEVLVGHPRFSYEDVENIAEMEEALRKSLVAHERYSFSRSWWKWDRLRARYVDGGRKDGNALRILRAVLRGLILDWHAKAEAKGEGDMFYIFFTTNSGNKVARKAEDGRTLARDFHGGGYHGGWGGASRMRIYEELSRQKMLTAAQAKLFRKIVHQSFEPRFLDFKKGAQSANNHSYGNGGGIALALKLFPDAPQAGAARAWLDRIWGSLSDFGDWKEWTYYPYGPIFLHGLLDVAEATGRIESDRVLINAVGRRALAFIHGGGVRGNPNSGAPVRKDRSAAYTDPWNVGYYNVETSSRDGNFWYRLAQHYKDPGYLWAAEQVALGGRAPGGVAPPEYLDAYRRRFGWFIERGIEPSEPAGGASIGLLSPLKKKIPERIYLNPGLGADKPFAAFFLYEEKSGHLDNVAGHLYEYSFNGAKLLHTSGKYNNVYSGDSLKGGGTGEESLDLLLALHRRHPFPLHPDRKGDQRDFMRRGSIRHLAGLARAENNKAGDSFGQYGYEHYYGKGSRWIRQAVLTAEGCLVIADEYVPGNQLGEDYQAGPVWHLAAGAGVAAGPSKRNWFDAPALDRAWWQEDAIGILLFFHDDGVLEYGSLKQAQSQDTDPNITVFAFRPIKAGKRERFLSVLVPHGSDSPATEVAAKVRTSITDQGVFTSTISGIKVRIGDGKWSVGR